MMAGRSIKNRASAETTTSLHGISFLRDARLLLKYIRALSFCQVKILQKGENYSRNGGGSGNADGALADILEALKNG